MDNINKLSFPEKIGYLLTQRVIKKSFDRYTELDWISYHMPKTAGTSFRLSLNEAFGKNNVYSIYAADSTNISTARPIWLPKGTKIIHGHFRPLPIHNVHFKNAKKLIWLRDPISRAWSLLNHTLDIKNNRPVYEFIDTTYLQKGITDREEIFLKLLSNPDSRAFFLTYSRQLSNLPKSFFSFVGNAENYKNDLKRLSNLMEKKLKEHIANTGKNGNSAPIIPSNLLSYFDDEYKIYEIFTKSS